jgi:hypothetical protein
LYEREAWRFDPRRPRMTVAPFPRSRGAVASEGPTYSSPPCNGVDSPVCSWFTTYPGTLLVLRCSAIRSPAPSQQPGFPEPPVFGPTVTLANGAPRACRDRRPRACSERGPRAPTIRPGTTGRPGTWRAHIARHPGLVDGHR